MVMWYILYSSDLKKNKYKKGEGLEVALHMVLPSIKRQANILVTEN
jgi:hypothetical protein